MEYIPGKAKFVPASSAYRAGWVIDNPRGKAIYFETKEEAEGTAQIWADQWNRR